MDGWTPEQIDQALTALEAIRASTVDADGALIAKGEAIRNWLLTLQFWFLVFLGGVWLRELLGPRTWRFHDEGRRI